MVPVSTISSISFVPIVTSISTDDVTVTAYPSTLDDEPLTLSIIDPMTESINDPMTSYDLSTPAMTISPIKTTSTATATYTSFVHSAPMTITTMTEATTVYPTGAPFATAGPYVDVNTGNASVIIGDTCQRKYQPKRGLEIQSCIAKHEPQDQCNPFGYACDCFQLEQAVECYKPQYHDCKRDGKSLLTLTLPFTHADHCSKGYYIPLVLAYEEACALKTLQAKTYTELSTSMTVFTKTH